MCPCTMLIPSDCVESQITLYDSLRYTSVRIGFNSCLKLVAVWWHVNASLELATSKTKKLSSLLKQPKLAEAQLADNRLR